MRGGKRGRSEREEEEKERKKTKTKMKMRSAISPIFILLAVLVKGITISYFDNQE